MKSLNKYTTIKPITFVSSKTERKISKKIIKKGTYTKIDSSMTHKISQKYDLPPNIVECIYANFIEDKIIFGNHAIKEIIEKITDEYDDGIDISQLSIRFDYPALSLLRLIFKQKKYNSKEIKTALKTHKLIGKITQTDINQIKSAEQIDDFTHVDHTYILERSLRFEQTVADELERLGIKYITQEDLAIKQKKEDGIVSNTPDFYLTEVILINDVKINWIEVKNFFGSDTHFIYRHIQEQITRYYDKWGSGCLVFCMGCTDKLAAKLKKSRSILICSFNDLKTLTQQK